ncbi:response regulator transcription factor [Reichenbachiella carrageenanivorans]|uniref:Response regulator transcription factor n=1 Tax=Reichenbachiella carrageenanivorans TaxID=2979869 RepID=A0ABY6D1D5_9BACT|nr:response regulator transcription factor [Reichenbachiella carrageenanivorans]UXX79534.1 response regulator transcription factor [Reichenbachiella carrageenanivorans]
MGKGKVLVVAVEVIIARSIVSKIEQMGFECVGTAIGTAEGLEMIKAEKPDIALLDVDLKGDQNGIELADQLKKELNIPTVFLTTQADQKKVSAAKTMPYGYVPKSASAQDIFKVIQSAIAQFRTEKTESKRALLVKGSLFVKDEYRFVKLKWADMDYIKSDGNYVEIHGQGNRKVIKETLKNIEMKLPKDTFFKTHRSYLVNIEKIQSIGGTSIRVGEEELPIVKRRRDELLSLLMD